MNSNYASDAAIIAAQTALGGVPIANEDSLLLKQLVVILANLLP